MDANQTKLHLLLGKANWERCRQSSDETNSAGDTLASAWDASPPGAPCPVDWDSDRNELTLHQRPFRFPAGKSSSHPTLGFPGDYASSDRRGAARDRFGNWYFISSDRRQILVYSAGCKQTTTYWTCADLAPTQVEQHGIFKSDPTTPPPVPVAFSALAVTADHYLVVGTLAPGGIVAFDLHAGGPPRRFCWPADVPFEPFDMAPRAKGGVWILDRHQRRFWALDRHFRVATRDQDETVSHPAQPDLFQAAEGSETHYTPAWSFPLGWKLDAASPIEAADPVSIEGLPGNLVLILDASPGNNAPVRVYRFGEQLPDPDVLGLPGTDPGDPDSLSRIPPGYDIAFVPSASADAAGLGDLFIAGLAGKQVFRYSLSQAGQQLRLTASGDYYPMRLFGGMGLVTPQEAGVAISSTSSICVPPSQPASLADRGVRAPYYDSDQRWVPLTKQPRPQYQETATIISPTFDGREPGCVWHRLLLDACLPSETDVTIWSRASDNPQQIEFTTWRAEPPLYRRGDGSELPFMPTLASQDRGTFELLFQSARGRYLQIKLTLAGNGRSTPRLRALRVYYPRFSYATHYLPSLYREDTVSAAFLDRFLANLEGFNTAIEDKVAAVQLLFDANGAPANTLAWLATWFGIALDPAWDEQRQRLLLNHAMDFFQWRGTVRGLQMALHLAMDDCVDESIFTEPAVDSSTGSAGSCGCGCGCSSEAGAAVWLPDRFRIVERFLLRQAPAVAFGDAEDSGALRRVDNTARWNPNMGLGELRRRFKVWSDGSQWSDFDLGDTTPPKPLSTDESAARLAFARIELGFEPSEVMEDQLGWQNWLRRKYSSMDNLFDAYGTRYGGFDSVPLPADQPASEAALADWRAYLAGSAGEPFGVKRKMWQDFLARRYSGVGALRAAHGTQWSSFDLISYPTTLPVQIAALWDWYQFESLVLPTLSAAHRFTVLLPFSGQTLPLIQQRFAQLELARRLIEAEKPAHTVFQVKFYWALFRVGEARLGLDTVLGQGGRDPALLPPAVLGQTFLAETQLAPSYPYDVTERQIIGRDRLS